MTYDEALAVIDGMVEKASTVRGYANKQRYDALKAARKAVSKQIAESAGLLPSGEYECGVCFERYSKDEFAKTKYCRKCGKRFSAGLGEKNDAKTVF